MAAVVVWSLVSLIGLVFAAIALAPLFVED
jgi:hypothetical protein